MNDDAKELFMISFGRQLAHPRPRFVFPVVCRRSRPPPTPDSSHVSCLLASRVPPQHPHTHTLSLSPFPCLSLLPDPLFPLAASSPVPLSARRALPEPW
jgi:hypothetical protein